MSARAASLTKICCSTWPRPRPPYSAGPPARGGGDARGAPPARKVLVSPRPEPAPAVFGGPAHAEPSVAAHPPDHFPVDVAVPLGQHGRPFAGRDEPGEIVPEFVTDRKSTRLN